MAPSSTAAAAAASTPRKSLTIPPHPAIWSWRSVRTRVILVLAAALVAHAVARGSMSISLLSMTDLERNDGWRMAWTARQQTTIHTIFYIGALLAVFSADPMIAWLGAHKTLTASLWIVGACQLVTPFVVRAFIDRPDLCAYVIYGLRLLIGYAYGYLVPVGFLLISRWVPVSEKSTAIAIFTTGNQLGVALSLLGTAKATEIDLVGGWPLSFFASSLFTMLVYCAWRMWGKSRPRFSTIITKEELEYIVGKRQMSRTVSMILRTPYRRLLLSPCILSMCLCSFAQSLIYVALVTYLPRYFQRTLGMEMQNNGIWSSVPFFVQTVTKLLFGTLADTAKSRGANVTIVTKVSNGIASFGTAVCLLCVVYLTEHWPWTGQVLISISMALFSGYVSGYTTAVVSVAPHFTTTVSSYMQLFAQAASTMAPALIDYLAPDDTPEQWSVVFVVLAGVLIVSGALFQVFGLARALSWSGDALRYSQPSLGRSASQGGDPASGAPPGNMAASLAQLNEMLQQQPSEPATRRTQRVSYRHKDDDEPLVDVVRMPHLHEVVELEVFDDDDYGYDDDGEKADSSDNDVYHEARQTANHDVDGRSTEGRQSSSSESQQQPV